MRILFFSLSLLLISFVSFAQPGQGGPPPQVPITGGIALLIGAAIMVGVHAIRKTKQ